MFDHYRTRIKGYVTFAANSKLSVNHFYSSYLISKSRFVLVFDYDPVNGVPTQQVFAYQVNGLAAIIVPAALGDDLPTVI
jgi:hypothetical protein